MRVVLLLAWSPLLGFSLRSGPPSAQAFTSIMKHLHLCVIYLYSFLYPFLTVLGSVLVLGQPSVPGRTPWWRIHLAVDRTICFGNTICSTAFLGGGLLVYR